MTQNDQHSKEVSQEYHPCERLDFQSHIDTLLRGSLTLASNGEHELSQELAASAVGMYDIFGCRDGDDHAE